jgi:Tol biopolymer transport system component
MKRLNLFLITALFVALAAPSAAQEVVSTVAFSSTRDNPDLAVRFIAQEIYFMDYLSNGTFGEPRRMTNDPPDAMYGDYFATFSPDGRGKVVWDSNRRRTAEEPLNTSDLFLMNHDGTERTFLTRGASPTWAPPGPNGTASKRIAFHASASGTGLPVQTTPGAATQDSDIFVLNVDEALENGATPQNLTNDPFKIDDDPDWSPDGQTIVFTSHLVNEPDHNNSRSTDIWVMNADGSAKRQLTFSAEEERAPSYSPDGQYILFMCKKGSNGSFEVCVMNSDGFNQTRLTFNTVADLTPTWSPDGQRIIFHRGVPAVGTLPAEGPQLHIMDADGQNQLKLASPPGINHLAASWDVIEVGKKKE